MIRVTSLSALIIKQGGKNMPLVSMTEMLNKALEGKYAVGQFNINNLEWTQAILAAAEEENNTET